MTYKLKSHHHHTGKYWEEREMKNIREKYKGKIPPYSVLAEEGIREAEQQPQRTHQKGRMVYHKGKIAVIEKTTQKGVWIKELEQNKEKGVIEGKVSKPIFISEKKAEKELSSVTPKVPIYFAPPFVYLK